MSLATGISAPHAEGAEAQLRIVPAAPPVVGNCLPFANNTSFGFAGFIYRNVPAFRLSAGARIAFDLGGYNDVDARRDIYFAPASKNPSPAPGGGGVRAVAWTRVVSEAQVPAGARGNLTVGDYDLRYTAETSFDFPGGGLVVGFGASPPATYPDGGCEQVVVHTTRQDPSDLFYARFWGKSDRFAGVLDDGNSSANFIAGMVIESDTTPPTTTATVVPPPDDDGWSDGPVGVRLQAADDPAGSGVASIRYAIDDGPETTAEGAGALVSVERPGTTVLRYFAVDAAGNAEQPHELAVRVYMPVRIDPRPGNPSDPVPARAGTITVGLLSEDGFDAAAADVSSLRAGPTGSEARARSCGLRDLDDDGRADRVCRFDFRGVATGDVLMVRGFAAELAFKGIAPMSPVGRSGTHDP